MDYDVLKPFNTVNRRLSPGPDAGGTISDADGFVPFTKEERLESGFIQLKSDPIAVAIPAEPIEPVAGLTRRSARAAPDPDEK